MTVTLSDVDVGSLIEQTMDQLQYWGMKDEVVAHFEVPPDCLLTSTPFVRTNRGFVRS